MSPDTGAPNGSTATTGAPTPPALRLPATAKPIRYEVELALDPSKEDFSGSIAIDLQLAAATDLLWLNGEELTVTEAALVSGSERVAVTASSAPHDFIAFRFAKKVGPGPATLAIKYTGKMHRGDGDGIYPVQEGQDWYVYTQFEATDARSAFPCFDEPSYKVPWQLTLRAPEGNQIVANTRAESEAKGADGWKAVRFAETKPLPAYLIAFAVGPMDFVDAGKTKAGAPIRVVTPRGQSALAGYAVQVSADLVARTEDYFAVPYPYDKLDIVAVPIFNAGAMENAGLITFRSEIMIVKPGDLTETRQRRYATVFAHEVAHQWFGDLVTLAWWDDTWLNEAFASWLEDKIIRAWKPEWELDVEAVADRASTMSTDGLASARKIRQPIESKNDIDNAFDGITYDKGKAVLHMFEQWLGEDVMQKGVRAYVAEHAYGNASYPDFVAALSKAAGKPLEPMLSTFVEQVGVPLVSFELACAKGTPPTLTTTQKRYLPVGSDADAKVVWNAPVCVKYAVGKTVTTECGVIDAATNTIPLAQAKGCPDWVYPNAEGRGYYRSQPSADLAAKLARHTDALSLRERVNLVSDLNALVAADLVPVGDALTLVAKFAKDKSRHLVTQSLGITKSIDDLVPDELRGNYQRFIRRTYGARARQLGWAPAPGENQATRALRPDVIELVASSGGDPELIKEATQLAWKWLDDHKAVDPTMVDVVLRVASENGDKKLWDRFYADARKTTDRQERHRLLVAMAGFTSVDIVKANHAIVLAKEFDLRDAFELMATGLTARRGVYHPSRNRVVRQMAWDFVKTNWDAILEQMPRVYAAYLAFVPMSLCSEEAKADLQAFFAERAKTLDGGPRIVAQAAEQIGLCAETRKRKQPGVVAFLKKQ